MITRFCLTDFASRVSDISALRTLLEGGAQIRGVRNLHAKLYLFGRNRAILTSANLTETGLSTNHELGFVAEDASVVDPCHQYFDNLWGRAGQDLRTEKLADWEQEVSKFLAAGAHQGRARKLGDEGVDVGIPARSDVFPSWVGDAEYAFVKFFGESSNRAARSMQIVDEVRRSGAQWACAYPKGKRPRGVPDASIIFMGRLVKEPNDVLIFGRAVAIHHEPGRDDATAADIRDRPWKVRWPHYVRVHHAEFIAGNMANGVSLNELMDSLDANSFASTQRNAGTGNTDPRRAYMQQPAVKLSRQGAAWLSEQLERAYDKYGRLAPAIMDGLDWPSPTS